MRKSQIKQKPMDIDDIRNLITEDMHAVDQLIRTKLRSDVALINQVGEYIINSGGKRLRPLVVLLAARACDYRGSHQIDVATLIEFIHTATLLHDDVVDASDLRRGQETANAIWGNEASVLVGDFLYSRSFQMMVSLQSMRIMEILADTTNMIAEGEVMQLLNVHDPDVDQARYMEVIRRKTAKLFEAAAQLGAVLAGLDQHKEQALADYGLHLGIAFQLVDDALDYGASSVDIGKNVGDDLAEGKPTLPLIHTLRNGNEQEVALVREAVEHGQREKIAEIIKAIESTGAIEYTARLARDEANKSIASLANLPESAYKEALISLANFTVERTY